MAGDSSTSIQLSASETVPLCCLRRPLSSARLAVLALGFKGCHSSSASFRGNGCASLINVADRIKLGKALGTWASSPDNSKRRIFIIVAGDLSQRQAGSSSSISRHEGHQVR
jgi:hypothetical protein